MIAKFTTYTFSALDKRRSKSHTSCVYAINSNTGLLIFKYGYDGSPIAAPAEAERSHRNSTSLQPDMYSMRSIFLSNDLVCPSQYKVLTVTINLSGATNLGATSLTLGLFEFSLPNLF